MTSPVHCDFNWNSTLPNDHSRNVAKHFTFGGVRAWEGGGHDDMSKSTTFDNIFKCHQRVQQISKCCHSNNVAASNVVTRKCRDLK